MENSSNVFLSAEWRDLVLLNYVVDPDLLRGYVPNGTTPDSFQGQTHVSLVGFRFCKTKFKGKLAVPFHAEFEEVNLRFYVRRETANEIRRGVVFLKEIVPMPAIALTARFVYGENYVSMPMQHKIIRGTKSMEAEYEWKLDSSSYRLFAKSQKEPRLPAAGSLEQYITEHYWGYTAQKNGNTLEYRVTHVPWEVSDCEEAGFGGDPQEMYWKEFGEVLFQPPDSAYFAAGSTVEVFAGAPIP